MKVIIDIGNRKRNSKKRYIQRIEVPLTIEQLIELRKRILRSGANDFFWMQQLEIRNASKNQLDSKNINEF